MTRIPEEERNCWTCVHRSKRVAEVPCNSCVMPTYQQYERRPQQTIYHRGMAEALGIERKTLENMTIRQIVRAAYRSGFDLELTRNGVGPGLTLSVDIEEKSAT